MKNLIATILTSLTIAVLSLSGSANAQGERRVIRVNVPFEFTVGEKTFPAGDYSLVRSAPDQLSLRDADAHVLTSIITHSVQSLATSPSTTLRFSTSAGGHVLTQVWLENENIGYELAAPNTAFMVAKRHARDSNHSAGAGTK